MFILAFASIHHSNSLTKTVALLSVAAASAGCPVSSKASCTLGTGNIAGTVHAPIFQSENCSAVITCDPPKMPLETVLMATGFLCHSSYSRSTTFFRLAGYPPLYSGVTMIMPSADLIFSEKANISADGDGISRKRSLNRGKLYAARSRISAVAKSCVSINCLKYKATE